MNLLTQRPVFKLYVCVCSLPIFQLFSRFIFRCPFLNNQPVRASGDALTYECVSILLPTIIKPDQKWTLLRHDILHHRP